MGGVQQQRQSEGRCGGEKVPFWSESVNYGKRKSYYPALQPLPRTGPAAAPRAHCTRSWPVPVTPLRGAPSLLQVSEQRPVRTAVVAGPSELERNDRETSGPQERQEAVHGLQALVCGGRGGGGV